MHSEDILQDMKEALMEIEYMIDAAKEQALRWGVESPYKALKPNGDLLLAPLITAKAALLVPLYDHHKALEAKKGLDESIVTFKEEWAKLTEKPIEE
jgi:hypothetical protein